MLLQPSAAVYRAEPILNQNSISHPATSICKENYNPNQGYRIDLVLNPSLNQSDSHVRHQT